MSESQVGALQRDPNCYTFREILIMLRGKVRRFYTTMFRKDFVEKREAARQGACHRCGACCKILYRCPFLLEENPGLYTCRIHGVKPGNCQIFPLTNKDLRDRDIVSPAEACGFTFSKAKAHTYLS